MDFLAQLHTFVTIADTRSITRAAQIVGLSVPMASRQLRGLEEELGTELVRRSTRNLQLTQTGLDFLGHARRLLDEVQQAKEAVRPGQGVHGTLVVSLPVAFGLARIVPLIPGFLARNPRLRLDLRFSDQLADMIADNVDIAIRAGVQPPDSHALIARRLDSYERVLCASPDFVAKNPGLLDVHALAGVSCLVQGVGPTRWRFDTAEGQVEVPVSGPLRTSNIRLLSDAAAAGLGVALLPEPMIAEELRQERLVRLLPHAVPPSGVIYGIYHRSARGSPAVHAFLQAVAQEIESHADKPAPADGSVAALPIIPG